jgi:hypothetical protein
MAVMIRAGSIVLAAKSIVAVALAGLVRRGGG